MLKVINFSEDVKYIVDKFEFESSGLIKNIAFMLDRNLDNVDFLESEILKRLESQHIEALSNTWLITIGLLDRYNLPLTTQFKINRDHTALTFIER